MTNSACWIDTVDDEEFWGLLKAAPLDGAPPADRLYLLPPPSQPGSYWINIVREWARTHGCAVRHWDVPQIEIEVPVTRAQLSRFLEEVFGDRIQDNVGSLHAYAMQHLRNDRTYLICADEW